MVAMMATGPANPDPNEGTRAAVPSGAQHIQFVPAFDRPRENRDWVIHQSMMAHYSLSRNIRRNRRMFCPRQERSRWRFGFEAGP